MSGLRDPFSVIHQKKVKTKGGEIVLDYVSWSQVADRLDEAASGWSFEIVQLGDDWCWGRLSFGGRKFENVGYAENAEEDWKKEVLKDAVSDALKRCAASAGVARYLYDRDAPRGVAPTTPQRPTPTVVKPTSVIAPHPPSESPVPEEPPELREPIPATAWDEDALPVRVMEGERHTGTHRPTRARANGWLFCPTKMEDGSWCKWTQPA